MGKLERIMAQIDAGTYRVSADKIVEKLLKKNPKLSDKVDMKTQIIGDMKGFNVSEYMDEGFTHLIRFEFTYNAVRYGTYLIGLYPDGTTAELDCIGDNFRDFDEDGLMDDAFESELTDRLVELELI